MDDSTSLDTRLTLKEFLRFEDSETNNDVFRRIQDFM